MRWLYALVTGAVALQPLHTPSRRLQQRTKLHVTGSEDDLRDEIARRNAAKADAPRVPTTQPRPSHSDSVAVSKFRGHAFCRLSA